MIRATLFVSAVLFAAACSQSAPEPAPETPAETVEAIPQNQQEATEQDTCDASRFQHLIGTPLAEVDQSTLPAGARLLTPDSIVTQDFRPDRLNIMSGADGLVSSLACY